MQILSDMNRREFLGAGLSAGMAAAAAHTGVSGSGDVPTTRPIGRQTAVRFRRLYAPHFGMFRHHAGDDLIDQLRFMADEGFQALEDNGLRQRPLYVQERIGAQLDRLGMRMGLFVGVVDFGNPTFASGREEFRQAILSEVRAAVETARRVNARWFTVVPGRRDPHLPATLQLSNTVHMLKDCAEICDAAGVVMLLEPLNHWGRHPQMFLHSISQGARVCRAVNSGACRVLCDVYHQQSVRQNILADITSNWDEMGYFQIGDSPGRKEPGTGGFDFRGLFELTDARGYDGIFGMEHGNSQPGREGERAVIDAYAAIDHAVL
jgi:hydroxypyruvate isomerase